MKITLIEECVEDTDGTHVGHILLVQVLSNQLPDLNRVRANFTDEQAYTFAAYKPRPVGYAPSCPHMVAESGYRYMDTYEFEEN